MKKTLFNISFLLILATGLFSCKDDLDYGPFNRDNRPEIPVTYEGATSFGGNPYLPVSAAQPNAPIQIRMEISANSGRTIKELTRLVGGTTAINVTTVTTGATAANTIATGIPAESGTAVSYTTSLAALRTKFPTVAALNGPTTATVEFTEFAFMSVLTLDNNETIFPVQLRLRIVR